MTAPAFELDHVFVMSSIGAPEGAELLRAGIPVVEHMTALDEVPNRNFRFFAVPVKVEGMGTFPVRAFALLSA